jgi:hypothetical protein
MAWKLLIGVCGMKTYGRTIFALVIGLTLLTQLAIPSPVYADDGTPPPPTESETEVAPPEEPAEPPVQSEEPVTEAAPVEVPVVTELTTEAAPAELSVSTEVPAADAAPIDDPNASTKIAAVEEMSLAEVVQEIPEQMDIVVLDETGDIVPLATQEAADIIIVGDPMWCPDGVLPGGIDCVSNTSFAGLINYLSSANSGTGINADGTIWIASSYDSSSNDPTATDFALNGRTLSSWANHLLTLQGGWCDGSDPTCVGLVDADKPSVFSVPITITNWENDITINNVTITGVKGVGLNINSSGNVNISNSKFDGNYFGLRGQDLKSLTISQSEFNNNGSEGATISDGIGAVKIDNSHFDGNGGIGLFLNGNEQVTIETSTFNNNSAGMHVTSQELLTLNDVIASDNKKGPWDPNFPWWASGVVAGSPTGIIVNRGTYSNNYYCGLFARTPKSLTLNKVTYGGNGVCDVYWEASSITIIDVNPSPLISDVLFGSQIEFDLSCVDRDNYFATLPNGDRIQIFCPVSGKASIKRLDNTMLPDDLPAGYTYASAFSLDIFQGQEPIPVISEGGNVRAMFKLPSLEAGTNYSILYWDDGNKKWIPLKEFMFDENGQPRGFPLYTNDSRVILSGLKFVTTGDYPHVEVSTNFPGIFVLAQR